MVSFDWNATAPLSPLARSVWLEATESHWANPSSPHRAGRRARLALEEARDRMARRLGGRPEGLVFTAGATEGNNAVIREARRSAGSGQAIWISAVEHASVREAARIYWGADSVRIIPVDGQGRVELDWIEANLRKERPALVSVMAVNSETGVIQPWQAIAGFCRGAGVPYHCDATQWMGKGEPADWSNCRLVTLSAHKFGGPRGVGALLMGDETDGLCVLAGGSQEHGWRAGTENLPGILAMLAAFAERLEKPFTEAAARERAALEGWLLATWPGEVVIHGRDAQRIGNTISVGLPVYAAARWVARLDRLGIAVSQGSACATGRVGPSAVLQAMGVERSTIDRTIRLSSGWTTTAEDWAHLRGTLLLARNELDAEPPPSGPGQVIQL